MNHLFKRLTPLVVLLLVAVTANAQNSFSIEEAIQYALLNNENLKNAKLDIEDANAQVGETRSDGLPQINGRFGYVNNPTLQSSIIDLSNFDPDVPEGTEGVVAFGIRNQADFNISASQLLWDGSFFVGLQAAKKLREKVVVDEAKAIEDVTEQVMKAYYLVLVNQVRGDIVEANIATLDSTLRDTRALYENGFAEGIEVSRLQVQMNNLLTERSAVVQSIEQASNLLKLSMGVRVETNIELTDEIREFDFTYDPEEVNSFKVQDRIEAQQLEYLKELAALDIKNIKAQYIPTVNLTAAWGRNTGSNEFSDVWKDNRWFSYSNIGVNVNIPIFEGTRKKHTLARKKYQFETLQNQSSLLQNDLKQQLFNARVALDVNVDRLEVQQETVDLAEEVLNTTTEKYREGIGSNLELVVADQDFKEAEVNYLIALYDAIVAKIDLDKALGKLN